MVESPAYLKGRGSRTQAVRGSEPDYLHSITLNLPHKLRLLPRQQGDMPRPFMLVSVSRDQVVGGPCLRPPPDPRCTSPLKVKVVTHTRNWSSAFNPSKCTHTAVRSEHTMNTHPEQWAAIYPAPGEQLGVQCLAQGHFSHGY